MDNIKDLKNKIKELELKLEKEREQKMDYYNKWLDVKYGKHRVCNTIEYLVSIKEVRI